MLIDMKNIVWLFFVALFSCTGAKDTVYYRVDLDTPQKSDSIFRGYSYVILENNKNCMLSNIEKILCTDSFISVLDKDRILFFSSKGKYMSKIDKRGRGNEEYHKIDDYTIQDSMVFILTRAEKAVRVYSFRGQYIRKIALDDWYSHLSFLHGNLLVLSSENSNETKKNFLILDIKRQKEVGRYDSFSKNESMTFPSCPIFCGRDIDGLFVIHPFDYSVYKLTDKGMFLHCTFDFLNHNVPEKIKEMSYYDAYLKTRNSPMVKYLGFYKETKNYIYMTCQMFDSNGGLCSYLIRINFFGKISSTKLGWNFIPNVPYISKPLAMQNDCIISAMTANQVLTIEKYYKLDYFTNRGLTKDDNFVIFFNKLVQ